MKLPASLSVLLMNLGRPTINQESPDLEICPSRSCSIESADSGPSEGSSKNTHVLNIQSHR